MKTQPPSVEGVAVHEYPEWPDVLGFPINIRQKPREVEHSTPQDEPSVSTLLSSNNATTSHPSSRKVKPRLLQTKQAYRKKVFQRQSNIHEILRPEVIDSSVCGFGITCKGARATRKCYNCVKYDSAAKGLYCDACFAQRHPHYRAPHKWVAIEEISDPNQEWLRQLARKNLEQDLSELRILLQQTRVFKQEAIDLGTDLRKDRGIRKAISDVEMIDRSIHGMMENIQEELAKKILTKEDAVTRIQAMWKVRKARQCLREMVLSVYKKYQDPSSGKFYYYNTHTKTTTWVTPLQLTPEEFDRQRPKKKNYMKAADMTDESAAQFIQNAFRSKRALQRIRQMIQNNFRKVFDEASQKYYYHNLRTGEVSWFKPKLLGSEDILTPRSKAEAARRKRRRRKNHNWSQDEAARAIQGMLRCMRARHYFRKLISSVYVKVYDVNTRKYYYHNTRTGQVTWIKPRQVDDNELMTPRSHALFLQEEKKKKKKKRDHPWTKDEAVRAIQGMYRCCIARYYFKRLISSIYVKIYDINSGRYYYHNTRTGQVQWTRPRQVLDEELMTPRSHQEFLKAERKKKKKPRDHPWTEDEAARAIQGMYQCWRSRKYFRKLISSVYVKIYDTNTTKFYYLNTRTQQVSWVRPRQVEDEELMTPRAHAEYLKEEQRKKKKPRDHPLTKDEAARMIQGMMQCCRARRFFRKLISSVYVKIYDVNVQRFYYHNTRTDEVSWTRPRQVVDEELMTPRSHEEFLLAEQKKKKTARDHPWTPEEAATAIQRMYRCNVARRAFRKLLSSVYEKILHEESGKYYYHNTKTGEVSWTRPRQVDDDELLTPRSRLEFLEAHQD